MSHGSFGFIFLNLSVECLAQILKAVSICSLIDCSVNFGVKSEIAYVNFLLLHLLLTSSIFLVLINLRTDIRKTYLLFLIIQSLA